ncbi:MAG TPA: BadF/BadG/BcrA/BcrD ATPase family protein [Bryobacteraceae bacterium]|nr:BadF/BadG/BcrA/BcrD ATPase family protein [Bryobacteraceae bacterium]
MSQYFLGVDGGQSSTTAVIGDEAGRVVGTGQGGPCNDLVPAIRASVGEACARAGLRLETTRFSAVCLGLSGGTADKEPVVREILRVDRMLLTDDATIALTGATCGEPGIVVIAGTGSIAYGRNPEGRTMRAGGWGYVFGDEGGAFWIARQAIRIALREEEGWGEPSSLRGRLLDATGAASMNDLMHRCYAPEFPKSRVAALAVLVDAAAEDGVAVARDILEDAARELVRLATAVRGQLFTPPEPAVVAWWGGVFRSPIVLARFRHILEAEAGVLVKPRMHEPAIGALLEAYRAAGLAVSNIPALKP